MIKRIRQYLHKRKSLNIQEFCHFNKDLLIIVLDPKTDEMRISYRDKIVSGTIKSMDGKDHHVVKNVLKHSTFEREIDRVIGAIIDVMKLPLEHGSDFFKFLDGALYNISQNLYAKKHNKDYAKKENG